MLQKTDLNDIQEDNQLQQKIQLYEKTKFRKALLCKICGKAYTQNSGIWHHMRDKHGFYSAENVEQICPKQQRVKRGRPKLVQQDQQQLTKSQQNIDIQSNNEQQEQEESNSSAEEDNQNTNQKSNQKKLKVNSQQQQQEEFTIDDLHEIVDFEDMDLDLEMLQNEHLKMMLSVIIEFGEPNKQRKYNILYNDFDDMDPFSLPQNELREDMWPELFALYKKIDKNKIENEINRTIRPNFNEQQTIQPEANLEEIQVIKMKNFCSKIILDVRKNTIEGFIQLFKVIWMQIFRKSRQEVDEKDLAKQLMNEVFKNQCQQLHKNNQINAQQQQQLQQQQTQKNKNSSQPNDDVLSILSSIEHNSISLENFLQNYASCTIGYVYNENNALHLKQYFGN